MKRTRPQENICCLPCHGWLGYVTIVATMGALISPAMAYTFNTTPDWDIELDTNLSYSLGIRTQGINPLIGNNPIQQNDEYKFSKAGEINSNRIDIASEFVAAYQNNYGIDISLDGWKDFAYDGGVATNPGQYGPGVSYSALSSSPDGRYGAYTYNNYVFGGELENAFAFGNFQLGNVPITMKIGRFTEYWGNALFSGYQAISYGQSPIDVIKAVDAPGTEVKDLFLPRGQISIHVQPTDSLTFGLQYAFEYRYNQFPEGGSFLGIADPFVIGPTSIEGQIPRGSDDEPPNVDGNFGLELLWEPDALNGTLGLYFRQFDDTTPYALYQLDTSARTPTYHLSYARHIQLLGLSLDHEIGPVGASFEASIRKNTGLNGLPGGNPANDAGGTDGPRGTLFNFVANGIYALTPNAIWQTGSLVGEIAWTHLVAVTHDASAYNAIGYACAARGLSAGSGERDGCSTQDDVNANVILDPQWLQVLPGVDVDAPMTVSAGLHGNGQTAALAGTGDNAASIAYSIGVHALIRQKYNIKLTYTGYSSPTNGITHTPLGKPYYAGGSGEYMWNDKESIDLVLSTAF